MSQPWMKFYPGDYLRDTRDLSPAEHGCYLLLIMHYWTTGGIPRDHERLARIVGADVTEWSTKWSTAVLSFFDDVDGEWRHGRIDEELAKAAEKHDKLVNSSRKGVEARLSGKPNGQPFGQPNGQPTPEPEPDKKEKAYSRVADATPTARKVLKNNYSDEFNAFWLAYPRTPIMSKSEALTEWIKLSLEDRLAATASLSGFKGFLKSKPDHSVIHACRYLKHRRFDGFDSVPAASMRQLVHVQDDTPEMDAWDRHWRQTKGVNAPRSKHGGIFVETQWPPGVDHAWDSNADQSPRA